MRGKWGGEMFYTHMQYIIVDSVNVNAVRARGINNILIACNHATLWTCERHCDVLVMQTISI